MVSRRDVAQALAHDLRELWLVLRLADASPGGKATAQAQDLRHLLATNHPEEGAVIARGLTREACQQAVALARRAADCARALYGDAADAAPDIARLDQIAAVMQRSARKLDQANGEHVGDE